MSWCGTDTMQVVSGRIDCPTVHFEAPPRAGLEAYIADFLGWFNSTRDAAPLDLTPWLRWFLLTLLRAIETATQQIDRVLGNSRYWLRHRAQGLSAEQIKVLNRLLDGDQPERDGFANGINAAQYQPVTKVSKATATRHLADLVAKGCLVKLTGGGRSTRYQIAWPAQD